MTAKITARSWAGLTARGAFCDYALDMPLPSLSDVRVFLEHLTPNFLENPQTKLYRILAGRGWEEKISADGGGGQVLGYGVGDCLGGARERWR